MQKRTLQNVKLGVLALAIAAGVMLQHKDGHEAYACDDCDLKPTLVKGIQVVPDHSFGGKDT